MNIRTAALPDLTAITSVEAACFLPSHAATEEIFADRLRVYPNHFWLLEDNDIIVGFINGMVTDEPTIRDEMFENAGLHNEDGDWQAFFGLTTIPEYRRQGYAAKIMERAIFETKAQGRRGCILTCKDTLIHYYEKFGYRNLGISKSIHGGTVWYDMQLTF